MKPRLKPLPLTAEDRIVLRKQPMMLAFHHLWVDADRRDADIMLGLALVSKRVRGAARARHEARAYCGLVQDPAWGAVPLYRRVIADALRGTA